jgi:hypothetical protein
MGPALSNEEGDHNATRCASNSSSTNASPEIITVSHSASRASPRSANSGCRFALCSRPRLLPFLFTVASSSCTNPIFRSGEDCRHFNFNSVQDIAYGAQRKCTGRYRRVSGKRLP